MCFAEVQTGRGCLPDLHREGLPVSCRARRPLQHAPGAARRARQLRAAPPPQHVALTAPLRSRTPGRRLDPPLPAPRSGPARGCGQRSASSRTPAAWPLARRQPGESRAAQVAASHNPSLSYAGVVEPHSPRGGRSVRFGEVVRPPRSTSRLPPASDNAVLCETARRGAALTRSAGSAPACRQQGTKSHWSNLRWPPCSPAGSPIAPSGPYQGMPRPPAHAAWRTPGGQPLRASGSSCPAIAAWPPSTPAKPTPIRTYT